MLETTDFSIQACRFLYSAASGYFTLSAALAALYFLRFRERFAAWHLALCLSLLFYTMSALALTYGPFSSKVTRLYLSIGFMVGPTIFTIYVDMAAQILHVKPKWLPTLLIPFRILPIAIAVDLFVWLASGRSIFFSDTPNPGAQSWYARIIAESLTVQPTIFLVLVPCLVSLFAVTTLLLIRYKEVLRKEFLLRTGIILTFLSQFHDISASFGEIGLAVPLGFAGYIFEVIRFNISLVEGYVRHTDRISARLKDSLMSFAQVRLSRQILHDVKSVRRNLLYKLEQVDEFSNLPETLKKEIDRLEIYSNGEIKSQRERISLHEICHTTTSLFDRELRELKLHVTFRIPKDLYIYACRNDVLIVLINLMQNSLEALNGKSGPWIRFEAQNLTDRILLRVSDSGKISTEEAEQIFRPGYSSKGSCRGLGLSIVQESLAANDALITLCDKSETTAFRIEFLRPLES